MAAALDLTQVRAQTLDINRKLHRGDGEVLKFVRLKTGKAVDGGGYKVLKEVTTGWNAKRVTKRGGNKVFEIKVADVDGSITLLIKQSAEVPTHCAIQKPGEDAATVYVKDDIIDPVNATRVWEFRCAPTGERKVL